MSATPADVSPELYERIADELEPAQLVELASTIAWENYRTRFNRAFDIASDDFAGGGEQSPAKSDNNEFSEGAACPMPVRDSVNAA